MDMGFALCDDDLSLFLWLVLMPKCIIEMFRYLSFKYGLFYAFSFVASVEICDELEIWHD